MGSIDPPQLKFPKCADGNPKYQFAATDYHLKMETQLQQEKRSAKLQVHLTKKNLTDAQTQADFVNRSFGKAKKKDSSTRPYTHGQVDLQAPDPLKETLNWLEYQEKVGSTQSPACSHQLYHASQGEFNELGRLLLISWYLIEVVRLRTSPRICPPIPWLLRISRHYPLPTTQIEDERERTMCHEPGCSSEQRKCIALL